MIFFHELIHLLAYPWGWKKKYVILAYPGVHVFHDGFLSKKRSLVMLISPVVIIACVIILLFFIFSVNLTLTVMFLFANLTASAHDIYVFSYIMKYAPKTSFGYGSAFTTDISKEDYVKLQSCD